MTVKTLNKLIADGTQVSVNGLTVLQVKSLHGVISFLTTRDVVKRKAESAVVEIEGKRFTVEPTFTRRKAGK